MEQQPTDDEYLCGRTHIAALEAMNRAVSAAMLGRGPQVVRVVGDSLSGRTHLLRTCYASTCESHQTFGGQYWVAQRAPGVEPMVDETAPIGWLWLRLSGVRSVNLSDESGLPEPVPAWPALIDQLGQHVGGVVRSFIADNALRTANSELLSASRQYAVELAGTAAEIAGLTGSKTAAAAVNDLVDLFEVGRAARQAIVTRGEQRAAAAAQTSGQWRSRPLGDDPLSIGPQLLGWIIAILDAGIPTIIAADDCDDLDPISLWVLSRLVMRDTKSPLAVLTTQSLEPFASDAAFERIAQLEAPHWSATTTVAIEALNVDEVTDLANHIGISSDRDHLADLGGLPGAIVIDTRSQAGGAGRPLDRVLQAKWEDLGGAVQRLLEGCAALGSEFTEFLLSAVLDTDGQDLQHLLVAASSSGWITPTAQSQWTFSSPRHHGYARQPRDAVWSTSELGALRVSVISAVNEWRRDSIFEAFVPEAQRVLLDVYVRALAVDGRANPEAMYELASLEVESGNARRSKSRVDVLRRATQRLEDGASFPVELVLSFTSLYGYLVASGRDETAVVAEVEQYCSETAEIYGEESAPYADALLWRALQYERLHEFPSALRSADQAEVIFERTVGPLHKSALEALRIAARAAAADKQLLTARHRASELLIRHFAPDDAPAAVPSDEQLLAGIVASGGDYYLSMALLSKARRHVLETEGRYSLNAVSLTGDLGSRTTQIGQHVGGLRLLRDAHDVGTQVLGLRHSLVLAIAGHLAGAYGANGQHDAALEVAERVTQARWDVLGSTHPDTLQSRHVEACHRGESGDHDGAIDQYDDLLPLIEDTFGTDSELALIGYRNRASYVIAAKRVTDAELEFGSQLLNRHESRFGDVSVETLSFSGIYGSMLAARRLFDEAVTATERAANGLLQLLGENHPLVFQESANAILHRYQAAAVRDDEAVLEAERTNIEQLARKAVQTLGTEHPCAFNVVAGVVVLAPENLDQIIGAH